MGEQEQKAYAVCKAQKGPVWDTSGGTIILATTLRHSNRMEVPVKRVQQMRLKQDHQRQATILWHVDDLKISHVDGNVVKDIINKLNNKFRQESPLVTSQGKTLEYLGMNLDYTTKGKVKISMYEYINKMLTELPSDMNGVSMRQRHYTYLTRMMVQKN